MKTLISFAIGGILGVVLSHPLRGGPQTPQTAETPKPQRMEVTLYRFELNPDKLDRFQEWVQFEHAHHAETVATLEREKMYFEAIFRDRASQRDVIYWLTIRGQNGATSSSSPLAIDHQYQQFMEETLKKGSRKTLTTEYALIPPFIQDAVDAHR